MTLNSIIKRIETISLAHKQIRNFYFGKPSDFLTDKTTRYPSVFLQDNGGNIDISSKVTTISFRMFLLDLGHVSQDTKANELDIQSDMISIAEDLIAQFNDSFFNDWAVQTGSSFDLVEEALDDMVAGVVIDITIRTPYIKDICAIPTDLINNEDMAKLVYDEKYVASGAEGSTLVIPAIINKKILLITREMSPLYKVSSSPNSSEFTWNNASIGFGAPLNPEERILILYREY